MTIKQLTIMAITGLTVAVVINASVEDLAVGLLGGLFIIFLWSKRP